MEKLNCAILQVNLEWEKIQVNIENISKLINPLKGVNVIVLPEMFTTGFTMNTQSFAEKMDGVTIQWLLSKSKEKNALIIGSIIIEEESKFYNRIICSFPNGRLYFYNKRHLFRMGDENKYFTRGDEKLIINFHGWNICPMVCYDLRFPVWSRNISNNYDLLVYVANWPGKRQEHWRKLLYARAIENQTYVIGVNRVGADGNGIKYIGGSMIIDPKGEGMANAEGIAETIVYATLDKKELNKYRKEFPVFLDAEKFKLI